MKKCVVLVAVAVLVALAAPAFAVTNPFMDVPMNHWAYDAIGQLAAKGVLSGYPDGTYKGKQPTTRYEMASALARALALVDMTKASKQDVEMLKKLVVEFKDELDALGVKVDQLDKRVAVLESRLGGWKLSGSIRVDVEDFDNDVDKDVDGNIYLARTRLEIQRWFGEDESMHLYIRLQDGQGWGGRGGPGSKGVVFNKFYVDFPIWWDVKMWAGRFAWDFEGQYRFQTGGLTDISNEAWLTDRTVDGLGWQKNFGLGGVQLYVARPSFAPGFWVEGPDGFEPYRLGGSFSAWEVAGVANLQFTEQFGLDIGGQLYWGDDSSYFNINDPLSTAYDIRLDSLWTIFAGLRFNFNENIALKGMYYYQDKSADEWTPNILGDYGWHDANLNDASAWKAILDVKQGLLGFSSLWLEYSNLEQGFVLPYGNAALWLVDNDRWDGTNQGTFTMVPYDLSIWRVGGTQRWNDKWSTWFYVAGHTYDNMRWVDDFGNRRRNDGKATQWGLGVEYRYNANLGFGLNYINVDFDSDAERASYGALVDNYRIQFRTMVSF